MDETEEAAGAEVEAGAEWAWDARGFSGVTSFADIELTEAEWLIDGLVPMAATTVVYADPGTGKTMVAVDWAARVTRGDAMPNGTPPGPPGSVVIASRDDDASVVLGRRLLSAGADMSRVFNFSEPDGAEFVIGGPGDHLPKMQEFIMSRGDVRMVLIDPLERCSSIAIGTGASKKIETVIMDPIHRMARQTGAAVVVANHLTKAGQLAGSRAILGAAESALLISKQPDGTRVISIVKAKLARDDAEPLRYRMAGTALAPRVEWLGEDSREGREGGPAQARILMALASSPAGLTGQKLASMTGLPYDSVRVLLTKLKNKGHVANARRGVWTVAAQVRVVDGTGAEHEASPELVARASHVVQGPQLVPDASGYGMVERTGS
jgi:hypothetical protein